MRYSIYFAWFVAVLSICVLTTLAVPAFATPIDAREGVGSGMSAHDRARTIAVAIAEGTRPGDLIRPGRLQTLRAVEGGVARHGAAHSP